MACLEAHSEEQGNAGCPVRTFRAGHPKCLV